MRTNMFEQMRLAILEACPELEQESINELITAWENKRYVRTASAGMVSKDGSVRYDVPGMITLALGMLAAGATSPNVEVAILACLAAIAASRPWEFRTKLSLDEALILAKLREIQPRGLSTAELLSTFLEARNTLPIEVASERFNDAMARLESLKVVTKEDGRVRLVEVVAGK